MNTNPDAFIFSWLTVLIINVGIMEKRESTLTVIDAFMNMAYHL